MLGRACPKGEKSLVTLADYFTVSDLLSISSQKVNQRNHLSLYFSVCQGPGQTSVRNDDGTLGDVPK